MSKPKMVCPDCDAPLVPSETRWGRRYDCPTEECTVMCWARETSTPADQHTRDSRIWAHAEFDALHRHGGMSRTNAYRWLRDTMGLPASKCHIGMFTSTQCKQVIDAVRSRQLAPPPDAG